MGHRPLTRIGRERTMWADPGVQGSRSQKLRKNKILQLVLTDHCSLQYMEYLRCTVCPYDTLYCTSCDLCVRNRLFCWITSCVFGTTWACLSGINMAIQSKIKDTTGKTLFFMHWSIVRFLNMWLFILVYFICITFICIQLQYKFKRLFSQNKFVSLLQQHFIHQT